MTEGLPGCSWFLATKIVESLESYWLAIVVYIGIDCVVLFLSFVLFMKRKDADVVPVNMRQWKPEPQDPDLIVDRILDEEIKRAATNGV